MSATANFRLTLCFRIRNLSLINHSLRSVGGVGKDFPNGRKNTRCFHQSFQRDGAAFSRKAKRVYYPLTDGELKAKESLSALPQQRKNSPPADTCQFLRNDDIFKSVMGELHATRNKHLVAIEGANIVEDAIKFGLKMKTLFLLDSLKTYPESVKTIISEQTSQNETGEAEIKMFQDEDSKSGPKIYKISSKILKEWSAVKTPPGIIGIFEKPSESLKQKNYRKHVSVDSTVPLTVVLDNIRDPGNLGSILRTAAGIGCKLLLSQGCTDPWDMKAIRSGNGAQFLVPLTTGADLQNFHMHIPLSDLMSSNEEGKHESIMKADDGPKQTENETSGIGVFLADSGTGDDEFGLPIVPYVDVQFTNFKSVFLVLGGENVGLRKTTKQAALDLQQIYPEDIKTVKRVTIPMQLPIDSLNVANSFGIIGYEIARQFTKRIKD